MSRIIFVAVLLVLAAPAAAISTLTLADDPANQSRIQLQVHVTDGFIDLTPFNETIALDRGSLTTEVVGVLGLTLEISAFDIGANGFDRSATIGANGIPIGLHVDPISFHGSREYPWLVPLGDFTPLEPRGEYPVYFVGPLTGTVTLLGATLPFVFYNTTTKCTWGCTQTVGFEHIAGGVVTVGTKSGGAGAFLPGDSSSLGAVGGLEVRVLATGSLLGEAIYVPEPSTAVLVAVGLIGLATRCRRRQSLLA